MTEHYTLKLHQSSDLRRLQPERRPSAAKMAARQLRRRYGVSPAYSKLIAEMQNYGGSL